MNKLDLEMKRWMKEYIQSMTPMQHLEEIEQGIIDLKSLGSSISEEDKVLLEKLIKIHKGLSIKIFGVKKNTKWHRVWIYPQPANKDLIVNNNGLGLLRKRYGAKVHILKSGRSMKDVM